MRNIAVNLFLLLFLYQPIAYSDVSLTASDGSGLEMKSFKAQVVLEGLFAFTEIDMVFHNPENRQREGRFQITLPQGAAISRFAMSRGNQLLEGEVVERQLAQRAYEDFLHRRQDPALLEVDQGNRFNARVFPIVAQENKRIIVSYSQTLTGGQFVLPLQGLPKLDKFSLRILHDANYAGHAAKTAETISGMQAQINNQQIIKIDRDHYQPNEDFILPLTNKQNALAVRSDALMAARIVPFAKSKSSKHRSPKNWVVLVDTSASQAPYLAKTLDKLKQLKAKLDPESWTVLSFDQVFRQHHNLNQIKDILALGASDLQQAIKQLEKLGLKQSRLLVVSDVVATAGDTKAKTLGKTLKRAGFGRVDVLLPSSHHDYALAHILRQSAQLAGVVADLKQNTDVLLEKLLTPNHTKVAVNVKGSKWFWPKTIDAIQAGEAITVFAELPASESINITIADKTLALSAEKIEPLLLKREWARARVERLSALMRDAGDSDMASALLQQIIKVSVEQRIITPYTALLVLESAADYQRYGIKQQAMADILSIGMEGISVVNRTPLPSTNIVRPGKMPQDLEENISEGRALGDRLQEKTTTTLAKSRPKFKRRAAPAAKPAPPSPPAPTAAPAPRVQMNKTLDTVVEPEPMQRQAPAQESRAREETAQVLSFVGPDTEAPPVRAAPRPKISPWIGEYKTFRDLLAKKQLKRAHTQITNWRQSQPQDVMALIALGEYFEAMKDDTQASRAYASLIDYFPARADIRRWAAGRLMRFKAGYALALDSLKKAVAQRPDHPSGHYLLAWAYWLNHKNTLAKGVLTAAIKRDFPRFAGSRQILQESLQLMNGELKNPQLRFVLTWETDANDVDFHVRDNENNHAYYSYPRLASGGRLYYDITTGYGPENFTINNPTHYPYKLSAHYYSMGPMGYGMGVLSIVRYQGRSGKIKLEFRPFVVMTNQAYVDLGQVNK